jgi:two-component system alkaline phosphatase synthesis response regulator PhoP
MPVVLLVDDDEGTSRAISRLLERVGYTAVWLDNGADALHVLKDLRFDLVILDWMMPEMDGLQVLRRLRDDPSTRDLRVMMYSAAVDPMMQREASRLGAVDCVLKSGGFPALYDRVESCLDRRDAHFGPSTGVSLQ